jgi:hypothetical protein
MYHLLLILLHCCCCVSLAQSSALLSYSQITRSNFICFLLCCTGFHCLLFIVLLTGCAVYRLGLWLYIVCCMWLPNLSLQIATSVVLLNAILFILGVSSLLVLNLLLVLVFKILLVTVSVVEPVSFFSILFACSSQPHHFHLENSLSFRVPPFVPAPVAVSSKPQDQQ